MEKNSLIILIVFLCLLFSGVLSVIVYYVFSLLGLIGSGIVSIISTIMLSGLMMFVIFMLIGYFIYKKIDPK